MFIVEYETIKWAATKYNNRALKEIMKRNYITLVEIIEYAECTRKYFWNDSCGRVMLLRKG